MQLLVSVFIFFMDGAHVLHMGAADIFTSPRVTCGNISLHVFSVCIILFLLLAFFVCVCEVNCVLLSLIQAHVGLQTIVRKGVLI